MSELKTITWAGDNQFEVEEFVDQESLEFGDELTFIAKGRELIVRLGDTLIKHPDGRITIQRGSGREGERNLN